MSDLVIIGREDEEKRQARLLAASPSFIKPGSGGKTVRYPDGRTVGPIGGELLRLALAKGAYVISEEPVETFKRPINGYGQNIS
jgi:hypothetical protein